MGLFDKLNGYAKKLEEKVNSMSVPIAEKSLANKDQEITELTAQINNQINTIDENDTEQQPQIEQNINRLTTLQQEKIGILNNEIIKLTKICDSKKIENQELTAEIKKKKSEIVSLNEILEIQDFGLYEPNFDFMASDTYKEKILEIREKQKSLIKNDRAVTGVKDWTVNGNLKQGQKMVNDTQKLLLRAFNTECDELVSKVKYNNYEASVKRISTSCNAISKLGKTMQITISKQYENLKIEELKLAFKYAQAKQKEKEEAKILREQMREEAKLQKEIEEQRKIILKEQTHYINAIKQIQKQLLDNPNDPDLLKKLDELNSQYEETEKAIKDIDYREANKRAGYVYVISNIGSFGENIYKIGMTRRLNPQERVDELGDASVPFNFDVHAMIFSDDAPALEAALHNAFESRKLNLVNHRREFFNVSLDEIKEVVKRNYDKTVEFIEMPDAEQFRMTQSIKNHSK